MHIHRYCLQLPSNLFLPGPTCRDEIRANAPHASGAVVLLLTRTTMNEPISANPSHLSAALGTFLSAIHHNGKEPRWLRLHKADKPESLPNASTISNKSRS